MRVSKRFDFHAAHVLPNHDGPCARLHGHTYVLEVVVAGRVKLPNGDPDEGMVVDFKHLKHAYKARIEPFVEHQNLNETLEGIIQLTTCEQMCSWMAQEFKQAIDCGDYEVSEVRLWETPTSYAEMRFPTPWT